MNKRHSSEVAVIVIAGLFWCFVLKHCDRGMVQHDVANRNEGAGQTIGTDSPSAALLNLCDVKLQKAVEPCNELLSMVLNVSQQHDK
jgi:hypothetical protein